MERDDPGEGTSGSVNGENVCVLCDESLVDDIMLVSEKCLKTLQKSSLQRKDSLHARFGKAMHFQIHKKCYLSYTHAGNIVAASKKLVKLSPNKQRSTNGFAFNLFCILCNSDASDSFLMKQIKKPQNKRQVVHKIQSQQTLDKIKAKAKTLKTKEAARIVALISKINLTELEESDNVPRYHHKCLVQFHRSEPPKPERPKTNDPIVEHVMNFLEKNKEECQFSLNSIMKSYTGEMQGYSHICNKLLKHHNDEIVISRKPNREILICYKDKACDILTEAWYTQKCDDPIEERKRIIRAAANIILEDVRGTVYDNNSSYPAPNEFHDKINDDVPETLKLLLDTLCTKNKTGDLTPYHRKSVSMAHSLIKIVRPNSFVSPLQVGVASIVHEKTGCKDTVNLLSNYGYTAPFHELKNLKKSTVKNFQEIMKFATDDSDKINDENHSFDNIIEESVEQP